MIEALGGLTGIIRILPIVTAAGGYSLQSDHGQSIDSRLSPNKQASIAKSGRWAAIGVPTEELRRPPWAAILGACPDTVTERFKTSQ